MRRFSDADLERWRAANELEVEDIREELRGASLAGDPGVSFDLRALSIAFQNLGFVHAARTEAPEARGYFAATCDALSIVYRACDNGVALPRGAVLFGDFQAVLVRWAVGCIEPAEAFASRVLACLRHRGAAADPRDSVYLGSLVLHVSTGDQDRALEVMSERPASIDGRFQGYAECLQAIAHRDLDYFDRSLSEASASWERYVGRAERGLPYSVFFLHGAGLWHLAKHVFGQAPAAVDTIPLELLADTLPKVVTTGVAVY